MFDMLLKDRFRVTFSGFRSMLKSRDGREGTFCPVPNNHESFGKIPARKPGNVHGWTRIPVSGHFSVTGNLILWVVMIDV